MMNDTRASEHNPGVVTCGNPDLHLAEKMLTDPATRAERFLKKELEAAFRTDTMDDLQTGLPIILL